MFHTHLVSKIIISVSWLLILTPHSVSAQVNVNNVIFTFKPTGRPVQNVVVSNSSSTPIYVTTKVEALVDVDSSPVKGEPTEDILVSPRQFSIEGNGERTIRMLLKAPASDVERGYRVYFIPQENEFGSQTIVKSEQGRTAVIEVATGVGILVFVDPLESKANFEHTRDATGITFYNRGNIQVYLGDGRACPPGVSFPPIGSSTPSEHDCTGMPSKRIYPGKSFHVNVPLERAVRYLRQVGSSGEYDVLDIGVKEE